MRSRRRAASSGVVLRRQLRQGACEALDRGAAGPHTRKAQVGPPEVGGLVGEQGLKSRKNERRLAAAGTADHGGEAGILHEPVERERLPLATEEEAAVGEAERT